MAGRIAYYGNIVTQGLVLDLDAAIQGSYPKTGSTWFDISNNGNNGTLTNGPLYTGSDYGAIVFDGVDDYVNTPYTTSIGLGNFSYNTWVNFTSSQLGAIIVKRVGAPSFEQFSLVIAGDQNGNTTGSKFAFNDVQSAGSLQRLGITSGSYNDGRWHNVTLTRTSTTTTMYVEGAPTITVTSSPLNLSTSSKLFIGRSGDNQTVTGIPFNGSLSTAQVYNQTLSQFQVWQNFNAYKSRYGIPDIVTDGLVLNLDAGNPYSYLSGSSGTTWTNTVAASSSISGTLVNGPVYSNGAITFDGVDDNLLTNFRPNFSYSSNQDFSLEIWFYLSLSSYSISLTAMRNTASGWVWAARSLSNSIYFSWFKGDGWIDLNSSESQKITPGRWNLGNLVYKSSTNNLDFYLNSNYIGYLSAGIVFSDSAPITIPRWDNNGSGYPNPQTFSKYSVYNRALTQAEITQNFNALRGRYGI